MSAGTLYFSSERKSSVKEGKERQWKTAVRTITEFWRLVTAIDKVTVITKFLRLARI